VRLLAQEPVRLQGHRHEPHWDCLRGFFTWGHHMFVAGQSTSTRARSASSPCSGVFTAIKVFNWWHDVPRRHLLQTPFAYICGFLYFLVFGGMTAWHSHTSWTSIGTTPISWWRTSIHHGGRFVMDSSPASTTGPEDVRKRCTPGMGLCPVADHPRIQPTFIPQFLLGNFGMPRRYYQYPDHSKRCTSLHRGDAAGFGS